MNSKALSALRLGALRDSDAPIIHEWRQDPIVRDGALLYPFPTSIEAEQEWIHSFAPSGTPQNICLAIREGDELLGYCQLRSIDWIAGVAELGIIIGAAHARGRGVGARALAMMMQYASQELRLRRLWLRVVESNSAAIRLYENAGFHREGLLLRHIFRGGMLMNLLVYGRELPVDGQHVPALKHALNDT